MKKPFVLVVATLLMVPLFSIAQVSPTVVVADISFDFHVGKEVLPAGVYSFELNGARSVVSLTNTRSGKSLIAPVLTRISQWPGNESQVVFDKAGDGLYLSELHAPGIDGFHFSGAPGPHTHVSVKGSRSK